MTYPQPSPRLFLIFFLLLVTPVFAKYPERIISGMPSITEMLFALDLGDKVVGVTNNCNYPPAAKKKEKIGSFFLNLEKTVSLKPDLIIMMEGPQKREIEKFRRYGLPVYTINPKSVDQVMNSLAEIGKVTGKEEKAKRLVSAMRYRLSRILPKFCGISFALRCPRTVVIVGSKPLIVVGGGTFIDDIIKRAGAENIAGKSRAAYPQYSFEQLLKEDPEYIIIARGVIKKEEIKNESLWGGLQAVKKEKILFINADILSRPGPRVVEAVEQIANFIQ